VSTAAPDSEARPPHAGLDRLIELLRTAKLRIGPDEVIDAARVLHLLAGNTPGGAQDPARLEALLRPVLCKTVADQAAFTGAFRRWHAPAAGAAGRPGGDTGGATPPEGATQELAVPPSWWRTVVTSRIFLGLLLVVLAGAGLAYAWMKFRPVPALEPTTQPLPTAPIAGQPKPIPTSQAASQPAYELYVDPFVPVQHSTHEVRPAWWWLLSLLPLLGCAPLLIAALPHIARRRGGGKTPLQAWPIAKHLRQLVAEIGPRARLQLQRPVRGAAEHRRDYARRPLLDMRRTIQATLAHMGIPSPRYRFARLRPSYLVLVQATSDDDLGVLWAERLRALDVHVSIFRFESDSPDTPPRCEEVGGTGRRFNFDQLPDPTSEQRLVVLARTSTLVGANGQWRAWADQAELKRWSQRALFTPDEPRDWNKRDVDLIERPGAADPGMFVLPFDDNALDAWSEWLVRGRLPTIQLSHVQRYPRLLQARERLFVGDADSKALGNSPKDIAKVVGHLVAELQQYLGENGFYWLCACAIAPLLDRRLALLIGEEYFKRCGVGEARLGYYMSRHWPLLVRLPWLRDEAPMPQWLRLALLARLPAPIQEELRRVIRGVIVRAPRTQDTSGLRLSFDVPDMDQPPIGDDRKDDLSLYLGFMRDGLSAESLVLRLSKEDLRWLPAMVRKASPWQRLGLLWPGRLMRRMAIRGQFDRRSVVFATAAVVVSALAIAAVSGALSDGWRDLVAPVFEATTAKAVGVRTASPIRDAMLDSDGRRLLTRTDDSAQVWDARTGQAVGRRMDIPQLRSARFSGDGNQILTWSAKQILQSWDAASGEHRSDAPTSLFSEVLDYNGSEVVARGKDNVFVMAADSIIGGRATPLVARLIPTAGLVRAVLSPDARRLVLLERDLTAGGVVRGRIVDVTSGENIGAPLAEGSASLRDVKFSADSKRIIATIDGSGPRIWDADTGAPGARLLSGAVRQAQFMPDGASLLLVDADGAVSFLNLGPGPQRAPIKTPHAASSVRVSADGTRLAVTSDRGEVSLWSSEPEPPVAGPMTNVFDVASGVVNCVDFSPDGRRLALTQGYSFRLWDARTAQPVSSSISDQSICAHFSPDGKSVAIVTMRGVFIVDAATGQPILNFADQDGILTAVYSPLGEIMATGSLKGVVGFRNVKTGAAFGKSFQTVGDIACLDYSPDGKQILATSTGRAIEMINVQTGTHRPFPNESLKFPTCASFSPDGKQVITTSDFGKLQLWDSRSARLVGRLPLSGLAAPRFSPDGRRIAIGSSDGVIRVFDSQTLAYLGARWRQPNLSACGLAWSPDSQNIAVATCGTDSPTGQDVGAYVVAAGTKDVAPYATALGPRSLLDAIVVSASTNRIRLSTLVLTLLSLALAGYAAWRSQRRLTVARDASLA
jgi:WD40 repeat protein/uncharacterized protein with von Willebrand factor type A (vWA) domain